MHFLKNALLGARALGKALVFIVEYRFYWYLIAPASLMLIIYYLGSRVKAHRFVLEAENMNEIIWYLFYLLLEISIGMLFMKFSKYLVVTLLSPLLSSISQKCERHLTGNNYKWSYQQLISDLKRATRIVLRNFMWEYFFFMIILLVSLLGWSNPRSSPIFYLTFVIGFYYYGFSFLDYINERRRLSIDESILFVRKNRGLAMVVGAIYSLLILVPVNLEALFNFSGFERDFFGTLGEFSLNLILWICASASPILAIVTATIAMHDLVDLRKNEYSKK